MENIIQHQLFQSSQYKIQPKLYVVQTTQLGFFYSQWRERNTLKSAIHPLLWKISTMCDSAFGATFLSLQRPQSQNRILNIWRTCLIKGIPLKVTMSSYYSSFEKKYLLGKLILDENGNYFAYCCISENQVYILRKKIWKTFFR